MNIQLIIPTVKYIYISFFEDRVKAIVMGDRQLVLD